MSASTSILHQLTLLVHLFAFAFAVVTILREDWQILREGQVSYHSIHKAGLIVTVLLIILWITGVALVAFKPGLDMALILANQKIAAKITVVSILTANGVFLHLLIMPKFRLSKGLSRLTVFAAMLFGVVSSVSWIAASLLGAARIISPLMTYQDFMVLYGLMIAVALLIALIAVGKLSKNLLASQKPVVSTCESVG